ncbi:unnamed protein product [Mytilus edulis]|uniref:Uncharacterized protein n=1 Tax=Mytilus edulis TaxID=6550 RepID=A0A8S3SNZ2_MYTED|nr:unnamed protein product [Mytilus edulis]
MVDKQNDETNPDNNDSTPLIAACTNGHFQRYKYLSIEVPTLIFLTKQDVHHITGHVSVIADINATDKTGRTPYCWSCVSGDDDLLQLLIDNKCDVPKPDINGTTPLMAAWHKRKFVNSTIDRQSAEINLTDNSGRTPYLLFVCQWKQRYILKLLINKECEETKPDNNGSTHSNSGLFKRTFFNGTATYR